MQSSREAAGEVGRSGGGGRRQEGVKTGEEPAAPQLSCRPQEATGSLIRRAAWAGKLSGYSGSWRAGQEQDDG